MVTRLSAGQEAVLGFVHLLFCAKNIERIADHATHIAQAAYLKATGQPLEPESRLLGEPREPLATG